MSLKKFIGLPGGANEIDFSTEGYKANSPDRNNPYNVIPSGNITMDNVPHPVKGIDDQGNQQMMYPGYNYQFPGDMVTEYPVRQAGGSLTLEDVRRPNPVKKAPRTSEFTQQDINPQFPELSQEDYRKLQQQHSGEGTKDYKVVWDGSKYVNVPIDSKQYGGVPIQTGGGRNREEMRYLQEGGEYIDIELDTDEIAELRRKGFRVDDL